MNDRLITVFGASGFLGRHVVRVLAKTGFRIRAVTRKPALAINLPPMGHVGQIQLFKGNVRSPENVNAALLGAHGAVNLVGVLYSRSEQSFESLHVEGAANIAEASNRAGVRTLVHVSALGADPNSESRYARSKAEGEARIRVTCPGARIFRPSVVFGPEDSFLNRFAEMARALPALPLVGGGKTKFQPVFVGDVAAAVLKAFVSEHTAGRTFSLGGPSIYSFRELMEYILRETHRKSFLVTVPFPVATLLSFFLQLLPNPMLTPDQVRLLRQDNVVPADAPGFADLGIVPTSIEAEAPAWLWRYRPRGQYEPEVSGAPHAT